MYQITFDKLAKKNLRKFDKSDQKKILEKIEELKLNPYLGERFSGNLFGLRRIRYDKFRIKYKIIEKRVIIIIINIKHRKEAY